MPKELSKGYSKYGADMGRSNHITEPEFPVKFHLTQLKFYDDAYDEGGAYWGMGNPIFHAWGDGEEKEQEIFVRANNATDALNQITEKFPNATFYEDPFNIDSFTTGYIDCALWSSHDGDRESLEEFSIHDINENTLNEMIQDCKKFQKENKELLEQAYKIKPERNESYSGSGHDFWLTRNFHGTGFWDRNLGDIGDKLTEKCKEYGEAYLYVENDKVYME